MYIGIFFIPIIYSWKDVTTEVKELKKKKESNEVDEESLVTSREEQVKKIAGGMNAGLTLIMVIFIFEMAFFFQEKVPFVITFLFMFIFAILFMIFISPRLVSILFTLEESRKSRK